MHINSFFFLCSSLEDFCNCKQLFLEERGGRRKNCPSDRSKKKMLGIFFLFVWDLAFFYWKENSLPRWIWRVGELFHARALLKLTQFHTFLKEILCCLRSFWWIVFSKAWVCQVVLSTNWIFLCKQSFSILGWPFYCLYRLY